MSVTLYTSHSPIGPCGQSEQSPFEDSLRYGNSVFELFLGSRREHRGGNCTFNRRFWSRRAGKHLTFACFWIDPSIPAKFLFERFGMKKHMRHGGHARHVPLGILTKPKIINWVDKTTFIWYLQFRPDRSVRFFFVSCSLSAFFAQHTHKIKVIIKMDAKWM